MSQRDCLFSLAYWWSASFPIIIQKKNNFLALQKTEYLAMCLLPPAEVLDPSPCMEGEPNVVGSEGGANTWPGMCTLIWETNLHPFFPLWKLEKVTFHHLV